MDEIRSNQNSNEEFYVNADNDIPALLAPAKNMWIMIFTTVVLGAESRLLYLILQPYWEFIAPNHSSLYGLLVGMYPLGAFVAAPLLGYMSFIIGFKWSFVFGLILNIIGNLTFCFSIYASADSLLSDGINQRYDGAYWLPLVGQFLAGLGGASIELVNHYVERTTSVADRSTAMGRVQSPRILARMGGPTLAMFIIVSFPFQINLHTTKSLVFNFYTIGGWINVAIAMLGIVALLFFTEPKKNPAYTSRHTVEKSGPVTSTNIFYHTVFFAMLNVIWMCLSSPVAEFFAYEMAQYKTLHVISDMYTIYIYVAIGALIGVLIWRKLNHKCSNAVQILVSTGLMAIAQLLLVNWNGPHNTENPPSHRFFIAASILFGLSGLLFAQNVATFFSKKVTQFATEVSESTIGVFNLVPAAFLFLGGFIGNTISGAILTYDQSSVEDMVKAFGTVPDVAKALGTDGESYLKDLAAKAGDKVSGLCLTSFPSYYFNQGCVMSATQWYNPMLAAVSLICMVYLKFVYFKNHGKVMDDRVSPV